jgi:hypothetical protein
MPMNWFGQAPATDVIPLGTNQRSALMKAILARQSQGIEAQSAPELGVKLLARVLEKQTARKLEKKEKEEDIEVVTAIARAQGTLLGPNVYGPRTGKSLALENLISLNPEAGLGLVQQMGADARIFEQNEQLAFREAATLTREHDFKAAQKELTLASSEKIANLNNAAARNAALLVAGDKTFAASRKQIIANTGLAPDNPALPFTTATIDSKGNIVEINVPEMIAVRNRETGRYEFIPTLLFDPREYEATPPGSNALMELLTKSFMPGLVAANGGNGETPLTAANGGNGETPLTEFGRKLRNMTSKEIDNLDANDPRWSDEDMVEIIAAKKRNEAALSGSF